MELLLPHHSINRAMMTATHFDGLDARQSSPPGYLEFQVRDRQNVGRAIRLAAAKCTIGSAPGCTLRLLSANVPELAVWVLRGTLRTIVRSRSPSVQLNGASFQDAELEAGDVLRVGPLELTVTTCPTARSATGQGAHQVEALERASRAEEEVVRLREELEQTCARARQHDELAQTVLQVREELNQQRQAFDRERDQFHEARLRLEGELARAARELETRTAVRLLAPESAGQELQALASELQQTRLDLIRFQVERRKEHENWTKARRRFERDQAILVAQLHERQVQLDEVRSLAGAHPKPAAENKPRPAAAAGSQDLLRRELQIRTIRFEEDRAAWDRERSGLQAKVGQLLRRLEELNNELSEARHLASLQTGQLTAALEEARRQRDALSASVSEQQEMWRKQQAQWADELQAARGKEGEGDPDAPTELLTSSITDLQSRQQQAEEHARRWQAEAQDRQMQLQENLAELTALRDRLQETERRHKELQKRHAELEQQRGTFELDRSEMLAQRQAIVELREELLQRQLEAAEMLQTTHWRRQELQQEQQRLDAQNRELATWQQSLREQQQAIDHQRRKVDEESRQLTSRQKEAVAAQTALQDAQAALERQQVSCHQDRQLLEQELGQRCEELKRREREVAGKAEQLAATEQAQADAATLLLTRQEELERLEEECRRRRESIDQAQQNLGQSLRSLPEEQHALARERDSLEQQRREQEQRAAASEQSLSRQRAELARKEEELQRQAQAALSQREEIERLDEQCRQSQAKLAQERAALDAERARLEDLLAALEQKPALPQPSEKQTAEPPLSHFEPSAEAALQGAAPQLLAAAVNEVEPGPSEDLPEVVLVAQEPQSSTSDVFAPKAQDNGADKEPPVAGPPQAESPRIIVESAPAIQTPADEALASIATLTSGAKRSKGAESSLASILFAASFSGCMATGLAWYVTGSPLAQYATYGLIMLAALFLAKMLLDGQSESDRRQAAKLPLDFADPSTTPDANAPDGESVPREQAAPRAAKSPTDERTV